MATTPDTIEFILAALGHDPQFTTRRMFGEYALYADGKVVALVCDDQLYVKIIPESSQLEDWCEKDTPYSGARLHYLVEEIQLQSLDFLPEVLIGMAAVLQRPKPKKKKSPKTR